jgi:hypothetical protein
MKTRIKNQKQRQGKNAAQAKVRIPVAPPTKSHSVKGDHARSQVKQELKMLLDSNNNEEGI